MYDRLTEAIAPLFQTAVDEGVLKQEDGEKAMVWYAALYHAAIILNTYTRTDLAAILVGGIRPIMRDEAIEIILSMIGVFIEGDGLYRFDRKIRKEVTMTDIVAQISAQVNKYLKTLLH